MSIEKECYFVSYVLAGEFFDKIVTIEPGLSGAARVQAIRQGVHPDRQGDPTDGMRSQRSRECVLVNFIRI